MDEHQFKDIFDIALSHIQDHGLNDVEQSELFNDMFDSFEQSFWEKPSMLQIPQKLAPAMFRVLTFAQELEDIREGTLKRKYWYDAMPSAESGSPNGRKSLR